MFIAALFMVAKKWLQPKCSSTYEWINKMWSVYKEDYSTIKGSKVLIHSTTCMKLENT